MRVRDRVGAAIRARLKVQAPDKAAAAALARWLARPSRAPLAASLVWRSADAVWRALGDRSTDENFYSKRVILAGVLTAVYVRWHADEDPAMAATHASIEARIDNVMQFEKLKARARPLGRWAESAVAAAARARYRSP
jgi:ubiquinone biosynthesis protein COQ9